MIMNFVTPKTLKTEQLGQAEYERNNFENSDIQELDQMKNRTRSLGNPLDWEFAKVMTNRTSENKNDLEIEKALKE